MNALVPSVSKSSPFQVGPRGGTTARPPVHMSYTYMAIADLMIAEPSLTLGEMAKRVGYTQPWLSLIVNTDMFKAYLAQRRAEFNAALNERISGKLSEATELALDSLIEGINTKGAAAPLMDRKEIVDTLLQRLGYGVKTSPSTVVNVGQQVEVIAVDRNVLHEARASLRAVEELKLAKSRGEFLEPAGGPRESNEELNTELITLNAAE